MKLKVPFNDLTLHHSNIRDEIDSAIDRVLKESSFIRGKDVDIFEERFSKLIGMKYCISCANGTDAIYIALKTLNIKSGDEVIVPAHSWISTSETVTQAGGNPVFCDTKEDFTIDPSKIESLITNKTVGIIPVHLYGSPVDMDPVMKTSKNHNLWIIEDCAQAHLSKYKGKMVGTFGNFSTFSFYPGKNLGAIGDAGAILCNDKNLAEDAACFARHGGLIKGSHIIEGINSRLDGIQAAILNIKLKYIEDWTDKRRNIAKKYLKKLSDIKDLVLPITNNDYFHVWHLFVIQHKDRNKLKDYLEKEGISSVINYPICLPLLPAYKRYNHSPADFPSAFMHQNAILSLPIFPEMTDDQISYVCNAIKVFCNKE
tara:strand:- start:1175 stop:2287 length:1113 start_codon:yes stop_codon:yes gene_type:complete